MYFYTIISPLALFSCRYHLLVKLTNTLNNCLAGFRLLFFQDFGFALWKCWRNVQDLNSRMIVLTFFFQRYACRFSKFYGHDLYFHLEMEGSLHNGSFFDSFQHKQNKKDFFFILSYQDTIRLTLPKLDAKEFIMFKISLLQLFHSEIPRFTFHIAQSWRYWKTWIL